MDANDFIYSALLSYQFIANCSHKSNADKKVMELKQELESLAHVDILNPGTYISMAYLFFVLAKETDSLILTLLNVIQSKFNIEKWDKNRKDIKEGDIAIIRRIRNAISHGKIDYHNTTKEFIFKDGPNEIDDNFIAKIYFDDFRELLLNDFVNAWSQQNK